jgi:hypothetical protein
MTCSSADCDFTALNRRSSRTRPPSDGERESVGWLRHRQPTLIVRWKEDPRRIVGTTWFHLAFHVQRQLLSQEQILGGELGHATAAR